ncbi:Catalase HPII [Raoultella terrigena]|uniref:catalase n=1 Tax=Raoultella terrigena TaxID=577 RepID=A0A4U9CUI9_RAOTE|nr:Catalase HPII [Raoultella terrigena]
MAVLLNDRPLAQEMLTLLQALQAKGVHAKLLFSRMGEVSADDGTLLPVAGTYAGSPSLTVDAVIVPGGNAASLSASGDAQYYLLEAYKHLKPILLAGDARQFKSLLQVASQGEEGIVETDVVDSPAMDNLLALMKAHRVWSRSGKTATIPA